MAMTVGEPGLAEAAAASVEASGADGNMGPRAAPCLGRLAELLVTALGVMDDVAGGTLDILRVANLR